MTGPKKALWFVKRHWKLALAVGILLYLVIGMLAPFVIQKRLRRGENHVYHEGFYTENPAEQCPDRAHVVEENGEALELRIRMAEEAKEHLILSTFDFREDRSTWDLAAALYQAAERGVKVDILVDGVSGLLRMENNPFFYAMSSHPNMEIRIYNSVNILTPWKLNGRMHDKYVICDDKVLLLGGRNTFGYFLGDYSTASRSHDREAMIYNKEYEKGRGESVIFQVQDYFESVWDGPYTRPFHEKEALAYREDVTRILAQLQACYEEIKEIYPQCFGEYSYEDHTVPIQKATLISGETGIYGKKPYVWDTLKQLMENAQEKVVFHTPYVVMDDVMEEGMREISKKVEDFSMVINAVENGDNVVASSDYLLHKKEILDTGVKLFEFDGGDSTHGKTILIDDNMSIIGSYNLDMRSTYMDTEVMLAIQGEEFYQELKGYTDWFEEGSRIIVDEENFEMPKGMVPQELSRKKKIIYNILGPLLQPVRYLA